MTSAGARIGFYSRDVKELLNDIKLLKPTLFASVPRLLNRVYDKVIIQSLRFATERSMSCRWQVIILLQQ